jgi:hypothetical protein
MPIRGYQSDPADTLTSVSRDHARSRRFARRWVAIACVLIASIGAVTAWRIHDESQPCWAVRQLIDFNHAAQDDLKAKTYWPPAGSYDEPRVPSPADYRAWADGLRQRADRVTTPDLSVPAHRLADLAREFLDTSNSVNDQISKQPAGSPTHLPPQAQDVAKIAQQFDTELHALNAACPAAPRDAT